jgi:hypothetical protein
LISPLFRIKNLHDSNSPFLPVTALNRVTIRREMWRNQRFHEILYETREIF